MASFSFDLDTFAGSRAFFLTCKCCGGSTISGSTQDWPSNGCRRYLLRPSRQTAKDAKSKKDPAIECAERNGSSQKPTRATCAAAAQIQSSIQYLLIFHQINAESARILLRSKPQDAATVSHPGSRYSTCQPVLPQRWRIEQRELVQVIIWYRSFDNEPK